MKTTPSMLAMQIALLMVAGCSTSVDDQSAPRETRPRRAVDTSRAPVTASEPTSAESQRAVVPAGAAAERLDPPSAGERLRAGRSAWERGEFGVAALELRAALDGGEGSAYDGYLLGLALWKSGNPEEAEELLADATWKMEQFVRAPVNLARVRLESGKLAAAQEAVERALAIDPEFGPAQNVLGRILLARGDRDAAAEAFQRAAELSPDNPWPLNNLGYALLVSGRADVAVEPLEAAIARDENLAVAWHNLALARERSGDLVGAAMAARRAVQRERAPSSYVATAERLAKLAPPFELAADATSNDPAPEESSQTASALGDSSTSTREP